MKDVGAHVDRWMEEHVKTGQHVQLREKGEVGEGSAIRPITIIEAGWGSSGYYGREMLERDGPRVFPAGTHMYINHPTMSEEYERPERDVKDLVGVVESAPFMAGAKLKSSAKVFEHWRPFVNEVAPHIGLSIRAAGDVSEGEAEGRSGPIVEGLHEGISVDYVTKAGAGGTLGENAQVLLESARDASTRAMDELVLIEALANRDTLLAEVKYEEYLQERTVSKDERVALAKKGQAIPVRDGQGNIVNGRFPIANCDDVSNAAQSIGRGNASNDTLKSFVKRVASKLSCPVPFSSTESRAIGARELLGEATFAALGLDKRGRTSGERSGHVAEISDQELSEIRESVRQNAEKITGLEETVNNEKTRADRAEDALFTERARNAVNEYIEEHDEGDNPLPELPERAIQRVKESVLGAKLPKDEDGKLDTERLGTKVREAFDSEAEYLGIKKGEGAGRSGGAVHGMGGRGNVTEADRGNGNHEQTETDEKELAEAMKGLGSSEKAAEIAARGR